MYRRVIERVRTWASASRVRWLLIALVLLAELGIYWVYASAGKTTWPRYMEYYDLQAEGFRSGHLYIPVEPHPELLTKPDPYDPANIKFWFWDVTLYKGRYYMYWGPVPGLMQAATKALLGFPKMHMVGDQYIVFVAYVVSAISAALLIERMQRRLFPTLATWVMLLAIFAFGMANPAPYLVATAGVYQASIGAAQAFLLLGLVFAFDAVWLALNSRTGSWRLVMAGVLWALALGSRISVLPAVALLVLFTSCGYAWPQELRRLRCWWPSVKAALVMAIPLGIGMGALLVYNKLRFDSFAEFGTNLQLSTMKFRVSTDYWLVNLYSYMLRPFTWACEFPYALPTRHPPAKQALAGWIGVPEGYLLNEPLVGWLRVVIVAWWLPVAVVLGYRKARALWTRARVGEQLESVDVALVYCVASFITLSSITAFMLLGLFMATMRYLSDVSNGLVLLGVVGAFTVITSRSSAWGRRVASIAFAASVAVTVVFGLLLGYQGYNNHFKRFNPKLDAKLQNWFSVCEAPAEPEKKKKAK